MDMAVLLRLPAIPFPLKHSLYSTTRIRMALKSQKNNTQVSFPSTTQNLPILLFDIMDTIVRYPFYHDVPAFFRMSFEKLIESKHPTAWIEFEKGMIDEVYMKLVVDIRLLRLYVTRLLRGTSKKILQGWKALDLEGLKNCMKEGCSYIEGVEELLQVLKHNNYQMHAFTNYPSGTRKPDPEFFLEAVRDLKVDPASCIFVDDRMRNVEAAKEGGIVGLHFKNVDLLRQDLSLMGVVISIDQTNLAQEYLSTLFPTLVIIPFDVHQLFLQSIINY